MNNNIEPAIRKLNKRVSNAKIMRIIKERAKCPGVQARRRLKDRLATRRAIKARESNK